MESGLFLIYFLTSVSVAFPEELKLLANGGLASIKPILEVLEVTQTHMYVRAIIP